MPFYCIIIIIIISIIIATSFAIVTVLRWGYKFIYQPCQVDSSCYCVMAAIFNDPRFYNLTILTTNSTAQA